MSITVFLICIQVVAFLLGFIIGCWFTWPRARWAIREAKRIVDGAELSRKRFDDGYAALVAKYGLDAVSPVLEYPQHAPQGSVGLTDGVRLD